MPQHPSKGRYALDFSSPQRHVATELAAAGPTGRTLAEMGASYHHPISGDLHRVRLHEHQASDRDAELWLLERAVQEFADQIEVFDGDRLRLAVRSEDLRGWDGKRVALNTDPHGLFRNPFDKLTERGVFADRSRAPGVKDDLSDLKESIRVFGFRREFPIIVDEHGVVISGRRRLRAAEELGVEPVYEQRTYGDGDEGTIARTRAMLASNIGRRPLRPDDVRFIAKRLYDDEGLTQAQIGERLKLSQQMVSRLLRQAAAEASPNGQVRSRTGRRAKDARIARRDIRVAEMLDQGCTAAEVEAATGVKPKDQSIYRKAGVAAIVDQHGGLGHVLALLEAAGEPSTSDPTD